MTDVKIEQVNRYTLTIGGVEYPDFKLDSEWEGMAKFAGPEGVAIVSKPDTLEPFFGQLFGKSEGSPCTLVKASPELLRSLRADEKVKQRRVEPRHNIGRGANPPNLAAREDLTAYQFNDIMDAVDAGEIRLEALRDTTKLNNRELELLGGMGVDAATAIFTAVEEEPDG